MPKNLPSLKAKQLIRLLESGGCKFYREGKGDHKLLPFPGIGQLFRIDKGTIMTYIYTAC